MSDEKTLAPCPFCGGEAEYQNDIKGVCCVNPKCAAGIALTNDLADARAAWNRRPAPTDDVRELARRVKWMAQHVNLNSEEAIAAYLTTHTAALTAEVDRRGELNAGMLKEALKQRVHREWALKAARAYLHDVRRVAGRNVRLHNAITRLRSEVAELRALFEIQQTRMAEATSAWQQTTGETSLPDLGRLLTWLLEQRRELSAEVERLRELANVYMASAAREGKRFKYQRRHREWALKRASAYMHREWFLCERAGKQDKQAAALRAQVEALTGAAKKVLALPVARKALEYLDRGIGTATEQGAWVELRAALEREEKEGA